MPAKAIHTPQDYIALAEQRGGKWVGEYLPGNTHEKTTWECALGHRWQAQFNNISAGRWCPLCASLFKAKGNARKLPEHYQQAAEKRGFTWLGPEAENVTTKTQWQCAQGHIWWATYTGIANVGSGCPYCQGVVALPPERFRTIAAEQNLEWLGPLVSYREKTWWQCPQGHRWQAQYGNVRHGRGCPVCHGERRKGRSHAAA